MSQALCVVYPNLFLVDALSLTDFLHSVCSCVLFFSVLRVLQVPLLMNLRSKTRIDYAVFHSTGEKVPKMANLEVEELKAREDLRHSLQLYDDIDNFDTLEDISEGVASISEAAKAYRHVHVELRAELGNGYATRYPNYDKTLEGVDLFLKRARNQRKTLKAPDEKLVGVSTTAGANGKGDIESLRINRDILDMKIKQVNSSMDLTSASDMSEVTEYIQKWSRS